MVAYLRSIGAPEVPPRVADRVKRPRVAPCQQAARVGYGPPAWSCPPKHKFYFEVRSAVQRTPFTHFSHFLIQQPPHLLGSQRRSHI